MVHRRIVKSFLAALLLGALPATALSQLPGRESDPVVVSGSVLPRYLGVDPASIVAFRYETGWVQVPLQADERALVDFGRAYGDTLLGVTTYCYTDTSTFVGADPDPTLDEDDEIVFMARDCGAKAPSDAMDPEGTVPFSRTELVVTDPLTSNRAYIYLFIGDGTLAQDAGGDYVHYNFHLLSGPYKSTYDTYSGPNPEDTEVVTSSYRTHFSDRWIRDALEIYSGSATGVDILDRHKNLFAPGNCARSEETFSNGEGGFFTNVDGAVRAIRSYLGANSGPLTQREHIFYESRQEITTHLRVHPISGVMDFYDYSPAASGMTYYNDIDQGGVVIDGVPDFVASGPIAWEMVTGSQGTLVSSFSFLTDIPDPSYTSYYSDDATPEVIQCTGDSLEYGASGPRVDHSIPNTDPFLSPPVYTFVESRIVYYEDPSADLSLAAERHQQALAPMVVEAYPTGISLEPERIAPELLQNFPNPFSGITTIGFRLPQGEEAEIAVFDVAGRKIVTLFVGVGGLERRFLTWDGRDRYGRSLAPGIYFYRLKSGSSLITRKMLLLSP